MAAIDVGSSGIRMDVARVDAGGRIQVLESLARSVPLGLDAFRTGQLQRATIDATVETLKNFKKVVALHQPVAVRAVGTSALREAGNADTLLDRVLHATGIEIEVIDGAEQNRLNFLAVRQGLEGVVDLARDEAAIIDVGAGSVDITLLEKGTPVASESQPMGSIRMLDSGRLVGVSQARLAARLRRQIRTSVSKFERNLPLSKVKLFIAIGPDMRFAADAVGESLAPQVTRIGVDPFRAFVKDVTGKDPDALALRFAIPHVEAEKLVPALLTYAELLGLTASTAIHVPRVSLRDGLVLQLAGSGAGPSDLRAQVLSSALALGRKYAFDEGHGATVASLAVQLFDALEPHHGLGSEARLYLEAAAWLHDVGLFIGSRAHHKHSFYVISASEIFGLSRQEQDIVANVARYHRRATPQKTHQGYMALPRKSRSVVGKLAAILRLADALDREHAARIKTLKLAHGEEAIEIHVPLSPSDVEGEQASFEAKKGLFVDVFGRDVVLRGTG